MLHESDLARIRSGDAYWAKPVEIERHTTGAYWSGFFIGALSASLLCIGLSFLVAGI